MPRLKPTPAEIEECIKTIGETPLRFAAATASVEEMRLTIPPGPKEWAALDILAHVQSCDDTWTYSFNFTLRVSMPLNSDQANVEKNQPYELPLMYRNRTGLTRAEM